jgi:uncharacterized membrane protein (UPF0127 family)|tara:strand:- start:3726 stop:4073 length:348 start_codon:yes stop_codon:yes gene_type:complete
MNVILHNKEIPLEIMDTPNAIETGMMGREYLEGGMLFIFSNVSERSFWMKDCVMSLDIVFIVNGKVTKVYYDCPPCDKSKCISYYGIADKVLELESNKYSIREGDTLEFTDQSFL